MKFTELKYTVSFNTPAFLGNAEQQAQWRTPPFKALLRQWWRVVKGPQLKRPYNVDDLRDAEKMLFGAAGEEGKDWGRSKVRLRLDRWAPGTLSSVPRGEPLTHPNVENPVGANLYLGYGPIGGAVPRSAIDVLEAKAEETACFRIRCPHDHARDISKAMQLAAWFGTLGSRSRNGWGALRIDGENEGLSIKGFADLNLDFVHSMIPSRALDACLSLDWPHAIGADKHGIPLIWRLLKVRTNPEGKNELVSFDSWQEVMRELARIKIAFRTSDYFKFIGGGREGHATPQSRHILAYPAGTRHTVRVRGWEQDGRLANQIYFKVHRRAGSGVKGVLRRAAEELALEGSETGWTWLDVWWLFGFEGAAGALWKADTELGGAFVHDLPKLAARDDLLNFIRIAVTDKKELARFLDSKEDRRGTFLYRLLQDDSFRQSIHTRGALDFWDVFPSPSGNKLAVEIMTPHHTGYLQKGGTPHDAEPPVPVSFLAVPAKSAFDFHVVCHETRLPAHLRESWRQKLDKAFIHAFEWLGFGAKTSVGYGAMGPQAVTPQRPAHPNAGRYAPNAGATETVWDKAQIKFNARNGTLTAVGPNNAQANAIAPQGAELLARLPAAIQQKVKKGAFVRVTATVRGSDLIGVVEPA